MTELDAQIIVLGHGEVMYDKTYLNEVADFVDAVIVAVSTEVFRLGSGSENFEDVEAAMHKKFDASPWRRKFAGDDKDNREFFDGFSYLSSAPARLEHTD